MKPIEVALDLGLIPVLYGDIILDDDGSFSIISGDEIILELCKHLDKYQISKVIFAFEEDGIFIVNEQNEIKLLGEVNSDKIDQLRLADLKTKIDVTGGIIGKLEMIKEICKLGFSVQVINGLKENNILNALLGGPLSCTNITPPKSEKGAKIKERKIDHLIIPLRYDVQHSKNYFKYIHLEHHSLPSFDLKDIDLEIDFFGKKISAPICIAAITGGVDISTEINKILATAAEKENIIMSVGSQRIALEDKSCEDSFTIVREIAPTIPIIGNLGIGQISDSNFDLDGFFQCIKMIKADAMAIHFNPLHELVQNKGNVSYRNFKENFQIIRKKTNIPIIAKEVGSGFNQEVAKFLDEIGFDAFDVGGAGGTSFAAIESYRDPLKKQLYTRKAGDVFREWGIPTPVSILNIRNVSQKLIIATGGLRTGLDIAKSITLGADIGGFAFKFLQSSWKDFKLNSTFNTINEIKTLKSELKSTLWLLNLKNVKDLKGNTSKRIIDQKLKNWIENLELKKA